MILESYQGIRNGSEDNSLNSHVPPKAAIALFRWELESSRAAAAVSPDLLARGRHILANRELHFHKATMLYTYPACAAFIVTMFLVILNCFFPNLEQLSFSNFSKQFEFYAKNILAPSFLISCALGLCWYGLMVWVPFEALKRQVVRRGCNTNALMLALSRDNFLEFTPSEQCLRAYSWNQFNLKAMEAEAKWRRAAGELRPKLLPFPEFIEAALLLYKWIPFLLFFIGLCCLFSPIILYGVRAAKPWLPLIPVSGIGLGVFSLLLAYAAHRLGAIGLRRWLDYDVMSMEKLIPQLMELQKASCFRRQAMAALTSEFYEETDCADSKHWSDLDLRPKGLIERVKDYFFD